MLGALIGGGLNLIGGLLGNEEATDESALNREFQERMSNTAYQRGMKDMRKAGLNPMLAYSQGGASVPTGNMANLQNPFAGAASAFAQIRQADAAEVQAASSAQQAETASSVAEANVKKINQEITNLKTDEQRIAWLTRNLIEENHNLAVTGHNLVEQQKVLRLTAEKLATEKPEWLTPYFLQRAQTELAKMQAALVGTDVKAAEKFNNLGADAKQLGPVFEFFKILVQAVRR